MKKYLAELMGTFTLVLFGCGTAVIAGAQVGLLGISFAFGFALIAMAYGIGPISGCHINPAVSVSLWIAGRMKSADLIPYILAQCIGAIIATMILLHLASGSAGYDLAINDLGQNGWGAGYQSEYSFTAAWIFELVASFIFFVAILGSTQKAAPGQIAGLAIGITLVVIHIFGIPITGVSVNPARSLGPALVVGGQALQQLWVFLVFPMIAAILAGILFRIKALEN